MSYENAARQQLRHKWWLRAVGILACLVVFITVYALVLPAITMEGTPTCGLEEHTHDAECYDAEGVLTCTLEEHVHDAACYAEEDAELAEPEATAEVEETSVPEDLAVTDDANSEDEDEEPVLAAAPVLRAPLLGAGGSSESIAPSGKVEAANEWQIVSGEYVGNGSANKDESSDHRVRVQKNVIATDTENLFKVYLSIDINRETVIQEILNSAFYVNTNNVVHHVGDEMGASDAGKADALIESGQDGPNVHPFVIEPSGGLNHKYTIYFNINGEQYSIVRYSAQNSFSNGGMYMKLDGKWIAIANIDKGSTRDSLTAELTDEAINTILSMATNVSTGTVSDTMGSNIVAVSIDAATGGTSTAQISADGKSISWAPTVSTVGYDTDGWYENVAELIYTIQYTPEVSTGLVNGGKTVADFSDAVVNTNGSAVLNYTVIASNGSTEQRSIEFDNPEIRGMLYAVKAVKLDNSGNALPGASFALYSDSACTNKVAETSSDEDGVISFAGLQFGTYYIKETEAPSGYKVDDTAQSVRLCYTDAKDALTGQGAGKDALYDGTIDATKIEFVNELILPTIVLVKQDFSGNPLNGAEFTVTGPNDFSESGVSMAEGSENYSKILVIEKAEPGTYNVQETKAPAGYETAEGFNITVPSDGSDISVTPGSKSVSKIDKSENTDGSHTYTIYIVNNPGIELPETGGMGTVIFTVSGLTLMAAAMLLLSKQRKCYDA